MTESQHSPRTTQRSSRWTAFVTSIFGGVVDEAVRAAVSAQRVEFDSRVAASIEPMLEWIRGAEAHLAALQADHDRLRALYEGRIVQPDQVGTRVFLLEARVDDLERAHTAMATAISKARVRGEMP